MVSLVDIVPQQRTVPTTVGEIELRGLGLRQIATLFLAFPALRNFFVESAPDVQFVEMMALMPDAVATVIAEAAHQPEAAEALADGGVLSPDEMLECLKVVFELTFPRGIAPLFQALNALIGPDALGRPGPDQGTNGQLVPKSLSPPDTMAAQ